MAKRPYPLVFRYTRFHEKVGFVLAGTVAVFVDSFLSRQLATKVTMRTVTRIVGTLLLLMAIGLGTGLI